MLYPFTFRCLFSPTRLTFVVWLLLFPMSSLHQAQVPIVVDATSDAGKVKYDLAGVSLGGGAHTFVKPQLMAPLKNLPIPLVRLEAVPGSFPNLYNPRTGEYDWTDLDAEIEAIRSRGAEIILNLFYTPQWLSCDPEGKEGFYFYAPPKDKHQWARLVADIVRHVNVEKKYNIRYWEFWNEPSGDYFWRGWKKNKEEFFAFYDVTCQAVKSVDPTAKVGGMGDNPSYPENYDAFFTAAKKYGFGIDFLTLHWYGLWEEETWKQPELYRVLAERILNMYHRKFHKPVEVFYTEWNLHAEEKKFAMDQQAAFMAQAMYFMQYSPITGAMFFRIENHGPERSLLSPHNEVQAPARVLQLFSRLQPQLCQTSDTPKDITVLSTRNADTGRLAVMASRYDYHPEAKPKRIAFVVTGLSSQTVLIRRWSITSRNAKDKGLFSTEEPGKEYPVVNCSCTVEQTFDPFSVFFLEIIPRLPNAGS